MKIKYVLVFGKLKMDLYQPDQTVVKELGRSFKKLAEVAEKYKLKVLASGMPLGMSEELVVMFDVGDNMDNYLRFIQENFATLPFTNMRTHPIVVP